MKPYVRLFTALVAVLGLLGGCAQPVLVGVREDLLHDGWFELSPQQREQLVSADAVLQFTPQDEARFRSLRARNVNGAARINALMEVIFGATGKAFSNVSPLTTTAAQTLQRHSGNCLSLALMTLALGDQLGLYTQLQEVRGAPLWERQGGIDFLNGHVNVVVRTASSSDVPWFHHSNDLVIDFDPEAGGLARGILASIPITRARGLAMFFNNRGAESFGAGQSAIAYAYYRQAIEVDPAYDASWYNLSKLYAQRGHTAAAENVLHHVLELNPDHYLALLSLQHQLESQGRAREAASFARALRGLQDKDPNVLYQTGMTQLARGDVHAAIRSLERATALGIGYGEFHAALQQAYRANGEVDKAQHQAELLAALDSGKHPVKKKQLMTQ